jgi:hypothetical protein
MLVLTLLSQLGSRAPERQDGWHRLAPSAMHLFALVGSVGMLLFLLFVGLHAPHFTGALIWTLLAFGVGGAIAAGGIRRVRALGFEWQGDALSWRNVQGDRVVRRIDELASVRRSVWGSLSLGFAGGESVKLDAYAQGCAELIERLVERRPELLQGSAR